MYISRWNELADELGLIVVYPMGTGFPLRWRTFEQNGDEDGPTREVQFIADLIDKLEMDYNIDPRRIYANGLSNGGGMTFLLACRLSDRIAAIGTVAGAYSYPWDACSPTRSVPLIAFHGDSDPIVPYLGGSRSRTGYTFPNLQDWIKEYARRNGCVETPLDLVVSESVSGVRYSSCRDEAEVVFYTIRGGGHTWPGGEAIPEWIAGYTSPAIDSTRVMWQFFQQHPLEK
jgi:polyhydroxybutyrate depolymerase